MLRQTFEEILDEYGCQSAEDCIDVTAKGSQHGCPVELQRVAHEGGQTYTLIRQDTFLALCVSYREDGSLDHVMDAHGNVTDDDSLKTWGRILNLDTVEWLLYLTVKMGEGWYRPCSRYDHAGGSHIVDAETGEIVEGEIIDRFGTFDDVEWDVRVRNLAWRNNS